MTEIVKLHYKVYGEGKPLLILHGFMGSLDNWHTLAGRFGSNRKVLAIDQRNHGRSAHTERHTISLMVADLKNLIETTVMQPAEIIGHSMGGKVAMQFALQYPDLVSKLIVVDIAPRMYKRGHDDVFEAIFSVDLKKINTRKDAEDMMLPYVQDFGTRQFLLKNLERSEDGTYHWKMNLRSLYQDYEEIVKPIDADVPFLKPVLVLKGEKSRYIRDEDLTDFERLFPAYELVSIPGAGHWVHAENPQAFYETVSGFIGE